MWSDRLVMPAPTLDDDLRFSERIENLAVQEFVAQPGIEALDIAVLPWTAWLDVRRLRTHRRDPFANRFRGGWRASIRLPGFVFPDRGLEPACKVQLAQHVLDMNLHGGVADAEVARNRLVVQAVGQTFKNLALAYGQ